LGLHEFDRWVEENDIPEEVLPEAFCSVVREPVAVVSGPAGEAPPVVASPTTNRAPENSDPFAAG
jgi:hypothetical protein